MSANVAMQFNARSLSHAEQRATLYHELVHSALTLKLYALRGLRVTISQNGYANARWIVLFQETDLGRLDEYDPAWRQPRLRV